MTTIITEKETRANDTYLTVTKVTVMNQRMTVNDRTVKRHEVIGRSLNHSKVEVTAFRQEEDLRIAVKEIAVDAPSSSIVMRDLTTSRCLLCHQVLGGNRILTEESPVDRIQQRKESIVTIVDEVVVQRLVNGVAKTNPTKSHSDEVRTRTAVIDQLHVVEGLDHLEGRDMLRDKIGVIT